MFKRVLVLAPHTDDGELGCGATVAKFIETGSEVFLVAFSTAVKSLLPGLPPNTLSEEQKAASAALGIPYGNLIIYDFPVREFPANRQEILERLVELRRELSPDLVLLPAREDIHQDHRTVAEEGIRSFKNSSIMGYELPWNNLSFKNNGHVVLDEKHVKRKASAISCYKSQSHRPYCREDFIFSLARVRGAQVGTTWAELFSVVRLVMQ